MRGRDFLGIARFLESLGTDASRRTRTGRLNYAAFLEGRSWCEEFAEYVPTKTGGEHSDVPRFLAKHDRLFAEQCAFLKRYRNAADYDLNLSPATIQQQEEHARVLAALIIARLDELAAERHESTEPETP